MSQCSKFSESGRCVVCAPGGLFRLLFLFAVGDVFKFHSVRSFSQWYHRRCAPMMLCCLAARSARRPGRFFKVLQKPLRLLLADPLGECVVC